MKKYIDHLLVLVVVFYSLFDRICIFIRDGFHKHTKTASTKGVLPQLYIHVHCTILNMYRNHFEIL